MPWEIAGQIGAHGRSGVDAHGWLWELHGAEARRVLVEIAGTAWAVHAGGGNLPADTVHAIQTEGRSEVERVAALDDPPRVVVCSTQGCRDRAQSEL